MDYIHPPTDYIHPPTGPIAMFKEFSKKKTDPLDMFKENLQLHIHLQPPPTSNLQPHLHQDQDDENREFDNGLSFSSSLWPPCIGKPKNLNLMRQSKQGVNFE